MKHLFCAKFTLMCSVKAIEMEASVICLTMISISASDKSPDLRFGHIEFHKSQKTDRQAIEPVRDE